ncbi:uncharacterized protein LOC130672743 [Microplitis mediator]|uniref:uncharacterized protein LOC130672743 n=1 Tax=Microplitis mediator TaxID=375433 RepID=UPI002555A745|nr:uncharacterized protein LOC130672743 [Microplitis mediator]
MLSVTSKLASIQKSDPIIWREYGKRANYAKFNNIYAISINEELLRGDRYSSGRCDNINPWNRQWAAYHLSYPNTCRGSIQSCWLKAKTKKRKAIEERLANTKTTMYATYNFHMYQYLRDIKHQEQIILDHTGNDCYCLCERHYNYKNNPRGDLLDSICYDPVSVDDGYVATGARFKRHDNVMYLELRQGILSEGRIDPDTLMWKISDRCNLTKKVVYNFRNDGTYDGLEIILEDMILPENAVVTGVTLGQSLHGRYINDSGYFDNDKSEVVKKSQCRGSTTDLVHGHSDLLPSTSLIGINNELSKSCEHKIVFGGTAAKSNNVQHVVPYVDLQEIVTDQNSPEPLRGIGWYYRSHPGYGGYLALKIFK